MKFFKKLFVFLLALPLALGFSSCGKKDNDGDGNSNQEQSAPQTPAATDNVFYVSYDYDLPENYEFLLDKLKFLARYYYDVKIIIVGTTSKELEKRLSKREKFELVQHSVNEAMRQQREYLKMADELREVGLNVAIYNNSGMSKKDLCKLIMVEQELE